MILDLPAYHPPPQENLEYRALMLAVCNLYRFYAQVSSTKVGIYEQHKAQARFESIVRF